LASVTAFFSDCVEKAGWVLMTAAGMNDYARDTGGRRDGRWSDNSGCFVMTNNRIIERRNRRRITLKENDGVYCIVAKAPAARKTITLPAKDISLTGFRFAIVSQVVRDLLETGKIYLKAIVGSRNLTFNDPVMLEIRWRNYDSSRTWIVFGCKIINISADARDQLSKFIEAEEKFRGIEYHNRLKGGRPKVEVVRDLKKFPLIFSRKIVTISGGSPQNRSLQKVLNWVEDELRVSGHRVERINLAAKTVRACDECGRCLVPENDSGCVQRDDVQSIIDKLIASDAAIYASPLCCWGFSSQLKALMDRCHRLLGKRNGSPKHAAYMKRKRQALIMTTSDYFGNNAEPLLTVFNRMLDRYRAQSAGVLFVCNCSTVDALGEDIKSQSVRFAQNLFGNTEAPYPVYIPGADVQADR
jgi:multimeric flavodoxin WrbA